MIRQAIEKNPLLTKRIVGYIIYGKIITIVDDLPYIIHKKETQLRRPN
jgi:hypothetical protein